MKNDPHASQQGVVAISGFVRRPSLQGRDPLPRELNAAAAHRGFLEGKDTHELARFYGVHESVVYNLLASGDSK